MMTRRIALLFGLLLMLSGCKQDEFFAKNSVVYCVDSSPQSMNPQLYGSGSLASALSQQVYDRLLTLNPHTQRLEGALAQKWQISRDGLTYTFTLRPGVRFHTRPWFTPTRDFNSEDVLFSFSRLIDKEHPYHDVSGRGRYPFFDSIDFKTQISAIRKLGDLQIQFVLNKPNTAFLANLASDYAVILSAEYGAQLQSRGHPEQMDTYAIGTGPFLQQEFRIDEFIRMHGNPDYWNTPPALERLLFDYTPKPTKRLAKLLTGECQVMAYPAASQLTFIRKQSRLMLDVEGNLNTAFLAINTEKRPFNDPRVRQAIAMGINRDNLLNAVYYDSGEWANSLLPPMSWAHNPNLTEYGYDPAGARALLKEANIASGLTMNLWIPTGARPYNPDALKMAQLISSNLANIGIRVKLIQMRWPQMRMLLREGRHDAVLFGWSADTSDPENFFRPLLSCAAISTQGYNFSRWCDRQFDGLLDQASATPYLRSRIEAYQQAQTLISEQLPLIPLAHSLNIYAAWKNLHNLEQTPLGGLSFHRAFRD